MVVLSAKTEERLREQAGNLLTALPGFADGDLAAIAYTLQVGRDAMEERLALTAATLDELQWKLAAFLDGSDAIASLYRGQVKRNREVLSAFADDDMAQALDSWIAKGKYGKLLDLWVKGLPVSWERLYGGAKPRRVELPTYPFARERYWVSQEATPGTAASAQVLHHGGRDEALVAVLREGEVGDIDLSAGDGDVRVGLSGPAL